CAVHGGHCADASGGHQPGTAGAIPVGRADFDEPHDGSPAVRRSHRAWRGPRRPTPQIAVFDSERNEGSQTPAQPLRRGTGGSQCRNFRRGNSALRRDSKPDAQQPAKGGADSGENVCESTCKSTGKSPCESISKSPCEKQLAKKATTLESPRDTTAQKIA